MKDTINSMLWTAAIVATVIAVVFGLLGELIGEEFALSIASIAGTALALCIYLAVAINVFSFNWKESPFLKITCAGIILAVLNYIVYAIYEWELLYTIFVVCAFIAATAMVIGIIKAIFGNV